jgi:hypothetical protein
MAAFRGLECRQDLRPVLVVDDVDLSLLAIDFSVTCGTRS